MGGARGVHDRVFCEEVFADLDINLKINLKIKLAQILKEENGIL
jgi:hypothetical protein